MRALEPITTKAPELGSARVVWVVRLIATDRTGKTTIVTKLIIDGPIRQLSGAIYMPGRTGLTQQTVVVN